ncbi:MAG: mitochondrial fission ELM1 family protein [Candidatus Omnitrophica bacterium]|nr:mitochondrial fission ELM1 family protein [Candidatus Omnitrophota bacterium]
MKNPMKVLILNDHVVGHLRQCEAVYHYLLEYDRRRQAPRGVELESLELNTKFQSGFLRRAVFGFMHPRRDACEGCDHCVMMATSPGDYRRLLAADADVVVTPFGKRTTLIARWLARRRGAKSVVLMKPQDFSDRYDLVVVPRHDAVEPRPNMVVTEGAPNAVRLRALGPAATKLRDEAGRSDVYRIGLLLGGDYKRFRMRREKIQTLVGQLVEAAGLLSAELFITTSRRTPHPVEEILKSSFSNSPACKLLVIANEANRPEVVPAVLSVCRLALVSPESVSMISEAATSDAHVLVYEDDGFLDDKHKLFLSNLRDKGFVHTAPPERLCQKILEISRLGIKDRFLDDGKVVLEGLSRIL